VSRTVSLYVRKQTVEYFFRYKIVRGTADCGGVVNRTLGRSRYGGNVLRASPGTLAETSRSVKKPKS
jgi:hypothetical protein